MAEVRVLLPQAQDGLEARRGKEGPPWEPPSFESDLYPPEPREKTLLSLQVVQSVVLSYSGPGKPSRREGGRAHRKSQALSPSGQSCGSLLGKGRVRKQPGLGGGEARLGCIPASSWEIPGAWREPHQAETGGLTHSRGGREGGHRDADRREREKQRREVMKGHGSGDKHIREGEQSKGHVVTRPGLLTLMPRLTENLSTKCRRTCAYIREQSWPALLTLAVLCRRQRSGLSRLCSKDQWLFYFLSAVD